MPSLKLKINPSNTFIKELKEITGSDYMINDINNKRSLINSVVLQSNLQLTE